MVLRLCTRRDAEREENYLFQNMRKEIAFVCKRNFSHTHSGDAKAIPAYFSVGPWTRTVSVRPILFKNWWFEFGLEEVHRRCVLLCDLLWCGVFGPVVNWVKFSRMSHLIAKLSLIFSSAVILSGSHWGFASMCIASVWRWGMFCIQLEIWLFPIAFICWSLDGTS